MPLITHALLYVGYALAALTTGLALQGVGGSSAAEAFLGGIGLFAALALTHAGLAAAYAAGHVGRVEKRIKGDIDKLRAGHRELVGDLDVLQLRLDRVDQTVLELSNAAPQAHRTLAAPTEMKLIDQLVDKLGRAIDARLDGAGPSQDLGRAKPRSSPIDIVREALAEGRVELHLQPIVSLPQRKTLFYEGFTRLRDQSGRVVMPAEFMPAAESAGLVTTIDNALLFRCVQIVRKLMEKDRRIGIFCNIAPKCLSDEAFFPQFLDLMRENRDLAGALIFELSQDAYDTRTGGEARAMARLADLGFRFSIDRVTNLAIDLQDLERSAVKFIKAPADLMVRQLEEEGVRPRSTITREIRALDVSAVCMRFGIDLIAERIETEDQVLRILDLEIPLAQGHLFGPPRPIKDSLMESTAPPRTGTGR